MSRLMIFTIAALVFGQASLCAQDRPLQDYLMQGDNNQGDYKVDRTYGVEPSNVELASPVEIHVAEDVDYYLDDVADANADVFGSRTSGLAAAANQAQDRSQELTSAFELTSQNWFSSYDVAAGKDMLTPALEILPLQGPEYDFPMNFNSRGMSAIASLQAPVTETQFTEAALDRRYMTRSLVVEQQGSQVADQIEEASPLDRQIETERLYAEQEATSRRVPTIDWPTRNVASTVTTPSLTAQSGSTTTMQTGTFGSQANRRNLVVARAAKSVRPTQQSSGLGLLMLPLIAGPLAWFGVQHYRAQKALRERAAGCAGCESMHVQCNECPETSEQREETASETMHYQRREAVESDAVWQSSDRDERRESQTSTGTSARSRVEEDQADQGELAAELRRSVSSEGAAHLIPETDAVGQANEDRNASTTQDDLTRIYGIGPATAEVLRREDITSFTDVAETDSLTFESILAAAGSRFQLINPTTWPTQAQYAAVGDWEGLEAWRASELEAMENDMCDLALDDCEQELGVLEDANALLATVSRIKDREAYEYEGYERSGFEQSPHDEFDYEQEYCDEKSRDESYGEAYRMEDETWSGEENDLTEIRGIGAATRDLLRDYGIRNFQELADADVEQLEDMVSQAGSRFQSAKPEAWVIQARELMNTAR